MIRYFRSHFLEKATLAFAGLALTLLLIQTVFYPWPDARLYGVTAQTTRFPRPAFAAILSGKFAADAEAWLSERLGFRGLFIKTANQINYSIFNETKAGRERAGTDVVLGRAGWLYEWGYIQSALAPAENQYVDVTGFSRFTGWATSNKVAVAFLFSPSKAAAYPEYLPSRYAAKVDPKAISAYRDVIADLDRHDLKCLDAPTILAREKEQGLDTFYPGDTHWNEPAVLQCILSLTQGVYLQNDASWPGVKEHWFEACQNLDHNHRELDALLNTWWNDTPMPPWLHARVSLSKSGRPPRILIIGNSFNQLLANVLTRLGFAEYVHLYFYNQSVRTYPGESRGPLADNMRSPNFLADHYDLIIFEANQSSPFALGYGFIDQFLEQQALMADAP